ncbi:hypothetical protein MMC09_002509 [Bachmanniomyces sp. S44760]|nr:hypothetical protein [Bachmanniomyces sp. S44760]
MTTNREESTSKSPPDGEVDPTPEGPWDPWGDRAPRAGSGSGPGQTTQVPKQKGAADGSEMRGQSAQSKPDLKKFQHSINRFNEALAGECPWGSVDHSAKQDAKHAHSE